jgi:hypothetical protein
MRPLNDYFLTCHLADVAAASTVAGVVVPDAGTVIEIRSVTLATTNGEATLTSYINSTAITGGTITIANAGTAPDKDYCYPTAANRVEEGDFLGVVTDGAGSTTVPVTITFVIRR